MKEIRKLAHLPNQEGFKFIGVLTDGSEQVCVIGKRIDGRHYVRGVKYELLVGWRLKPTPGQEGK